MVVVASFGFVCCVLFDVILKIINQRRISYARRTEKKNSMSQPKPIVKLFIFSFSLPIDKIAYTSNGGSIE